MRRSRGLPRLSVRLGVSLLVSVAVGMFLAVLGLPDSAAVQNGFIGGFALVGVAWMLVAVLSGGFVSTYRAPAVGNSLYYATLSKADLVLPADSPEVQKDLRDRMADQPVSMVRDVAVAVPLFVVAGAFTVSQRVGTAALAGVGALFVLLLVASRKP